MNVEPDGVGGRPACIGDVCITCSDIAVEVRVLRLLEDQMAVVDTGQGEETVSVATSVVSEMAGSARLPTITGWTNSTATCCASVLAPPVPNTTSLPPR